MQNQESRIFCNCISVIVVSFLSDISKQNPKFYTFSLFLAEHPYFTERVKSRTVFADETAILTCSFLGKPSPTATWSLANHLSHDDKRLEFVTTEESSTLILYNTVIRDTGEYACTVENSSGSTCCSARLDVKGIFLF